MSSTLPKNPIPISEVSETGLDLGRTQVETRLGLDFDSYWQTLEHQDFATAIEHLSPGCRVFACDSYLAGIDNQIELDSMAFRGQCRGVVAFDASLQRLAMADLTSTLVSDLVRARKATWLHPIDLKTEDRCIELARQQFIAMLRHKRCFGQMVYDDLAKVLGRDPTRGEWRDTFSEYKHSDRRALRSGVFEFAKYLPESTRRDSCMATAVLYSVLEGSDLVYLTSDRTVLEQFVTLCTLLTDSYLAWALAEKIPLEAEDALCPAPDLHSLGFESAMQNYRLPFAGAACNLPTDAMGLSIQCWLIDRVGSEIQLLRVGFGAECPMWRMLRIRGQCNGRNSDRFREANVHASLVFEQGRPMMEISLVVDRMLTFGSTACPISVGEYGELNSLRSFDLVKVQNRYDPLRFPWHTSVL